MPTRFALACAAVAAMTFGAPANARAQDLIAPWKPPVETPPNHFVAGHRRFDITVAGLRAYAATIADSDPTLYARLTPDVERLESRARSATVPLAVGAGAGLAATLACSAIDRNQLFGCGLIGAATVGVAAVIATALFPDRQDVLDVLNKVRAGVSF